MATGPLRARHFDTEPTAIRQNTTLQCLCLEDTQYFEQEAYQLCGEAQTIGIAFRRDALKSSGIDGQ
jgi:hypothetical protein